MNKNSALMLGLLVMAFQNFTVYGMGKSETNNGQVVQDEEKKEKPKIKSVKEKKSATTSSSIKQLFLQDLDKKSHETFQLNYGNSTIYNEILTLLIDFEQLKDKVKQLKEAEKTRKLVHKYLEAQEALAQKRNEVGQKNSEKSQGDNSKQSYFKKIAASIVIGLRIIAITFPYNIIKQPLCLADSLVFNHFFSDHLRSRSDEDFKQLLQAENNAWGKLSIPTRLLSYTLVVPKIKKLIFGNYADGRKKAIVTIMNDKKLKKTLKEELEKIN